MRIAVSADEDSGLDSAVSHHFNAVRTTCYEKDEVGRLEEEAAALAQQMAKIQRRIDKKKSER